jgi:hypothetical protein
MLGGVEKKEKKNLWGKKELRVGRGVACPLDERNTKQPTRGEGFRVLSHACCVHLHRSFLVRSTYAVVRGWRPLPLKIQSFMSEFSSPKLEFAVLRFADSEWPFYEFLPPMGIVL